MVTRTSRGVTPLGSAVGMPLAGHMGRHSMDSAPGIRLSVVPPGAPTDPGAPGSPDVPSPPPEPAPLTDPGSPEITPSEPPPYAPDDTDQGMPPLPTPGIVP